MCTCHAWQPSYTPPSVQQHPRQPHKYQQPAQAPQTTTRTCCFCSCSSWMRCAVTLSTLSSAASAATTSAWLGACCAAAAAAAACCSAGGGPASASAPNCCCTGGCW